jgi:4-amino-4-deoxy-L-arabinose transferase-like glycosyltransferase
MLLLWIGAGLALGFGVGRPPVQRTQEARVLETARQMRGAPWRGWLVPRINGNLRLQKPPLAYWMAAISYDIAGVSTTSGRIPTVICGWLTLGMTFIAARRVLNVRAAFFAAACLLSSYLFFRHDRLAETDAPAALFVTTAMYAWWRALDEVSGSPGPAFIPSSGTPGEGEGGGFPQALASFANRPLPNPPPEYRRREKDWRATAHPGFWFNIGAVATALAVMFKGGPGAFPPIFLLGMIAIRRQWAALHTFLRCGALLVLVALAAPWFLYAKFETKSSQISGEVDTLFSGQDHFAPFYHYGPELLKAAAPWSFVVLAAIGLALYEALDGISRSDKGRGFEVVPPDHGEQVARDIDSVRTYAAARLSPPGGLLIWAVSILLPLCVIGNKQFHYLLPLMPPLMILAGWLLDRASDPQESLPALAGALIDGTLLLSIAAVPLVLLVPKHEIHHIRSEDWALAWRRPCFW